MQKNRSSSSQKPYQGSRHQSEPRALPPHRNAPVGPKTPVASVLRIRNFKSLVDVGGEENLSLALGMGLHRVKELLEGFNFTDETAYHIETTLGLANGFMDQVNPRLTDANIARLKAPLEHEQEPEHPPAVHSSQTSSPSHPAQEQSMNKNSAKGQAKTAAKAAKPHAKANQRASEPNSSKQTETVQSETKDKAKGGNEQAIQSELPMQNSQQTPQVPSGAASEREMQLREIRRQNLHLITKEPGAKSELGRITGMSPANISHRLHGNKHFDEGTVAFFSEKLGLPADWFNIPHEPHEVPEEVLARLRQKSTNVAPPRATSPRKASTPIPTNLGSVRAQETGGLSLAAGVLHSGAATPQVAAVPRARTAEQRISEPAGGQSALVLEDAPSQLTVSSAPEATAPRSVAMPSPVVDVVQSGGALGPIAEALIKTLAAKSRQGRLSEEKAFQLLTEAMNL